MKNAWVLLTCCSIVIACNSADDKSKPAEQKKTATATISAEDERALEMISELSCTGCHKLNERFVGPSYTEVANKYPVSDSTINYLSKKIITGGQGVWGSVPMTAHPDLHIDSAKLMVKYIMTLKENK
ncbi:MAG: cytochrome c class I [Candidatus Pseudobacter hemicellulosilyticus]|uniref:Cytochrome c class I n=1 Tax=Candidatus Pseudobacter hemicellulosilyticus TaxID=3121375 RepID=A0AAJ5WWG0_9BACT|nr:MAG: cytochrome c class I [Pseudobacter sp.]